MKNGKKLLTRYLVTAIIAGMATCIVMWLRDYSSILPAAERYKILSDAFTVPGVILIMFSGIMWVASDGFFDGLGYVFGRAGSMLLPFFKKKHQTYYDYKTEKAEKRDKHSFLHILIVGAVFTAVAAVFVVLYESVQ